MGTWSGDPFGNDSAADWAWELDGQDDWDVVRTVLDAAVESGDGVDDDDAVMAIAAAEAVAHGLGRATQDDPYTESVAAFAKRAPEPPADLVQLALDALAVATGPSSGLTELWADDPVEWNDANAKLEAALKG
jgi:hypothetical protein